jgi:hypothetical protein
MTVTLYRADGRVLFTFKRPEIESNDAFDAGGLRFEVIEPSERLRTTYSGSAIELAEPRDMADPRAAFASNPKRRVELDLEHRAVGPMYGHSGNPDEERQSAEQQFAKAHYEQHMHVTGHVSVDGERIGIEGYGLRDHSWGPRHWQAIHGYEWLTMNFGADLGLMVSLIRREPGSEKVGGVVVRGDEIEGIGKAHIDAQYEPGGLYHRALTVTLETKGGESLEIEGIVKGFIPLRNRRNGLTTHIGEGMTEWRLGDRRGYGLSEFLRQV